MDITSKDSIQRLFQTVAPFDALISVTGAAAFKSLAELTDEDFQFRTLELQVLGERALRE